MSAPTSSAGNSTYGDDSSSLSSTSQGGRISFGSFGGLAIDTGRRHEGWQSTALLAIVAVAAVYYFVKK